MELFPAQLHFYCEQTPCSQVTKVSWCSHKSLLLAWIYIIAAIFRCRSCMLTNAVGIHTMCHLDSFAGTTWHRGTCPHFSNFWARGQTRNWRKYTARHESAHQNEHVEPKKWRDTTSFFRRFAPDMCSLPRFQNRSGATGCEDVQGDAHVLPKRHGLSPARRDREREKRDTGGVAARGGGGGGEGLRKNPPSRDIDTQRNNLPFGCRTEGGATRLRWLAGFRRRRTVRRRPGRPGRSLVAFGPRRDRSVV